MTSNKGSSGADERFRGVAFVAGIAVLPDDVVTSMDSASLARIRSTVNARLVTFVRKLSFWKCCGERASAQLAGAGR